MKNFIWIAFLTHLKSWHVSSVQDKMKYIFWQWVIDIGRGADRLKFLGTFTTREQTKQTSEQAESYRNGGYLSYQMQWRWRPSAGARLATVCASSSRPPPQTQSRRPSQTAAASRESLRPSEPGTPSAPTVAPRPAAAPRSRPSRTASWSLSSATIIVAGTRFSRAPAFPSRARSHALCASESATGTVKVRMSLTAGMPDAFWLSDYHHSVQDCY